jgi:two-component system chemotaxis response regulator CheB
MVSPKFIVVVGTSAGGVRALEELILQLTPDMDAAFFFVLHLSRKGVGHVLFRRIEELSPLPVKIPDEKLPIEKGVIYIAPPDKHMLLEKGFVLVGRGAHENRWRPSINNLFRTAAAAYSSRVIGIVLTGLLDDGTAGMATIKRVQGITIVQNPEEADYPDMPLSVLQNVEVDYVQPLSKMGILLSDLMANIEPVEVEVPRDITIEAEIDQRISTRLTDLSQFEKFDINCPECGGGLWITQKEAPTHYRCHVGHSFTDRELLIRMSEVLETTFWTSLRMMEERRNLLLKLYKKDSDRGYESSANKHLERAEEMEVHINNLKQILLISTEVE